MKRIITLFLTVLVIASGITSMVGAVDYSDLRPTDLQESDSMHYINLGYDDRLQRRANCYGYAMRLHYLENDLPYGFEGQIPGEFYDRSGSGMTYEDFILGYNTSALSVFTMVMRDCEELGYEISTLCSSTSTTYVPPSASTQPNKRLIVLVGKSNTVDDFHFLVQTEGDIWTQKFAEYEASTNCLYHDDVVLTNENIAQHIRCFNETKSFGSTAIYFYVDAPGTTDRGHYFHEDDSTQTLVRMYEGQGQSPNLFECAGNVLISSETMKDVTTIQRTGFINHYGDVDHFVFDVETTKSYSFSIYTDTSYNIKARFLDVTNVLADSNVNSGTSYSTGSNGQVTFSKHLTAGRRYCLIIFSSNQTHHESDRSYVISIN